MIVRLTALNELSMNSRYAFMILLFVLVLSPITKGQEYVVEKLNENINTRNYDEISPVISKDGNVLFFTRVAYPIFDRTLIENKNNLALSLSSEAYNIKLKEIYSEVAKENIAYPNLSSFNQDIWMAYLNKGDFSIVSHPPYPLNNALPNSVCNVSYDGSSVILINQFDPNGGMKKGFSTSTKQYGGQWSFPNPIYIHNYYNTDQDVSLSVNIYENVMILSLSRDDSIGENDLYVSIKTGPYSWSAPKNLGPDINSVNREITPFLAVDNRTLYFSSNRPGTRGGSDIFISKRIGDGWDKWTLPRPIKSPINSFADDSNPIFDFNSGFLYFNSKRDGSSDIFRVRIATPVSDKVTIKGRILDGKTDKPLDAAILAGVGDPNNFKEIYISEDGSFKLKVPKGVEYKLIAKKQGFIGQQESVSFRADYTYFKEYEINLTLNPIEAGTKISIKPIYFEQSKPVILEKSFPHLNELAEFLEKNKNLYITIQGHTDNQGKKEDLLLLSQQRADAIKQYLIYKKFIRPVRLNTEGFGDTRPVNNNKSEEERRQNRRVEIVVNTVSKPLNSQ